MGIKTLWQRKGGYYNWWLQRVSLVSPALLLWFLLYQWLVMSSDSVLAWHAVFQQVWLNVLVSVTSLSILVHAYLGIWTVCTDYIHHPLIRPLVHLTVLIVLVALFVWGLWIASGVGL